MEFVIVIRFLKYRTFVRNIYVVMIICTIFMGIFSINRYVCWTAYLLRYHGKTGHVEPVPLPGAPFSHYYATDATDEGIIMETDICVKEVSVNYFCTC